MFSEIEKTIERGFRRWTERVFGAADSDQLLLVHRAILEEIEGKVQVVSRGQRVFPYNHLAVTLASPDPDRRAVYHAAFAGDGRLEKDIRVALESSGCDLSRGFSVEVRETETGDKPFNIEYSIAPVAAAAQVNATPAPATRVEITGRLVVVKGLAERAEYLLDKPRLNIGRMAEITDSEQRVLRRNDIVFDEGSDDANTTVSRRHAHIRLDAGEYRICDDESEFGTRVFRDGRPIEVPAGNRRGERLRPGDEIYLGRACLRFER
jgi:hypothetical protein